MEFEQMTENNVWWYCFWLKKLDDRHSQFIMQENEDHAFAVANLILFCKGVREKLPENEVLSGITLTLIEALPGFDAITEGEKEEVSWFMEKLRDAHKTVD